MRRALATLVLLGGTSACFLVYGFDHFDDTATPDGGVLPLSLVAPASVLIEPGTSVVLDVRVAGRDAGAVTITATPDDAASIAITPMPVDGGVAFTLATPASLAASIHAVHLRADDGTTTAERDVRVDVEGVPCHLDRGFADAGVATVPIDGTPSALVVTEEAMTLGTSNAVARLTTAGQVAWSTPRNRTFALAVDDRGRTVVLAATGLSRLDPGGAGDPSFADNGSTANDCVDVALVGGTIVMLCGNAIGRWFLYHYDDAGTLLTTSPIVFGDGSAPVAHALTAHQAGLVACGTDERGHGFASFARWSAPDTVDTSFGVGGRFLLADDTSASACVGQGSAVVAAGTWGGAPALYAIDTKGVPQPSFGDGGVALLASDTQVASLVDLVTDRSQLVALVRRPFGSYLLRLSANGAVDSTFGACVLDALGLPGPTRIAVTSNRRLVVLASDGSGGVRVGRLWL